MKNYLKKIKKLPSRIDREIETFKYKNDKFAGKLNILNVEDSISYIEKNKTSFYRYGDGEIALMMGEGIAFQQADEQLAKRLIDMLKPEPGMDKIKAAIPYYYFNYEHGLIDFVEGFAYAMKKQRRFLLEHCDKDYVYLDTSISQIYQSYEEYDFDSYFRRVRNLFKGRNVTLICGKGIFKNIKYNLLDECDSVQYMEAPSKNAYSEYDEILKNALTIPKDNLVCIVLGPTAKPLAYDLFKAGYQAWDIGHFIKDYDAWCKNASRDEATISEFYRPD
jgi:glycosyltransferase family protein